MMGCIGLGNLGVKDVHLSAALFAKSLASCLKRRQFPSFGKSVSSDTARATITGGGKSWVRALAGYMPQKAC